MEPCAIGERNRFGGAEPEEIRTQVTKSTGLRDHSGQSVVAAAEFDYDGQAVADIASCDDRFGIRRRRRGEHARGTGKETGQVAVVSW